MRSDVPQSPTIRLSESGWYSSTLQICFRVFDSGLVGGWLLLTTVSVAMLVVAGGVSTNLAMQASVSPRWGSATVIRRLINGG